MFEAFKKFPKLDEDQVRVVMQDLYEQRLGLFAHSARSRERPLSSNAHFPEEDALLNGPMYDIHEEYITLGVKEIWGLSIIEYMELPRYRIELMKKVDRGTAERRKKSLGELEASLQGK